jgi:hypothetical protein
VTKFFTNSKEAEKRGKGEGEIRFQQQAILYKTKALAAEVESPLLPFSLS